MHNSHESCNFRGELRPLMFTGGVTQLQNPISDGSCTRKATPDSPAEFQASLQLATLACDRPMLSFWPGPPANHLDWSAANRSDAHCTSSLSFALSGAADSGTERFFQLDDFKMTAEFSLPLTHRRGEVRWAAREVCRRPSLQLRWMEMRASIRCTIRCSEGCCWTIERAMLWLRRCI